MELHTLHPQMTAANLDRTLAVAYDATHGFSDQYLVELDVFLACAREAGLAPAERFQARFPPSDPATISINLFTASAVKQRSGGVPHTVGCPRRRTAFPTSISSSLTSSSPARERRDWRPTSDSRRGFRRRTSPPLASTSLRLMR